MKIGLSYVPETHRINNIVDTRLSFKPFIAWLKNRLKTEKTPKAKLYQMVLDEFYKDPICDSCIKIEEIHLHAHLLELIYVVLTPFTADEKEYLWAMAAPVSKNVFYGTDAYVKLINSENSIEIESTVLSEEKEHLKKRFKKFVYKMILDKYYNLNSISFERIIYSHLDADTGLNRYYQLKPDTRFIDINYKNELPVINFHRPELYTQRGEVTAYLEEILPLSNFYLEGFTVITIEDITDEHAIDMIKKTLISHTEDGDMLFEHVRYGLKLLVGNKDIEFGMLPFLSLNNKLVFDDVECTRSVLMNVARKSDASMASVYTSAEEYVKNPEMRLYPVIGEEEKIHNPHMYALRESGVQSYGAIPVYYNQTPVGILEVYSRTESIHYEQVLARLDDAIPLVAQLLQDSIGQFNQRIDNIIQENFTSIQSSVQWKFRQVAYEYHKALLMGKQPAQIGTVAFHNVYPLYGMVDIRNSTVERNHALAEDIENILKLLYSAEADICDRLRGDKTAEVKTKFGEWYGHIDSYLELSDSGLLNLLLQTEVVPYLSQLTKEAPEAANQADALRATIQKDGDEIAGYRNRLEIAIQTINSALNNFLQRESDTLKAIYPCYFETFRTDGVEYDLYAGQSIRPDQEFTAGYLEAFRLWQLRSMCEIVRMTDELAGNMPRPLHTTQLIYVNPHPINISFRNDERHFDVDGGYNIRYQVVKKRIDKVHIKETGERLTQPGKIAIVYFNDNDASLYINYIKQLQREGLLHEFSELLELEELQGIYGLKALRVSVRLD
jgi:hypothetical protein